MREIKIECEPLIITMETIKNNIKLTIGDINVITHRFFITFHADSGPRFSAEFKGIVLKDNITGTEECTTIEELCEEIAEIISEECHATDEGLGIIYNALLDELQESTNLYNELTSNSELES